MKLKFNLFIAAVLIFLTTCSELSEDFSNSINNQSSTCSAIDCHGTTILAKSVPESGKHLLHLSSVNELNITCTHCHSTYPDSQLHKNGIIESSDMGFVVFDKDIAGDIASWNKSNTTCSNIKCHVNADWYEPGGQGCSFCHKTSVKSRRQIFDTNGDGSGTGGDFKGESHHVIDYNNRNNQIIKDSDCIVCHDQSQHMSGTVRLKDKDNDSNSIVYNPASPSTLEPFCLSCHDNDGATTESSPFSPFSSSNTLGDVPNRAGIEIKASWDKEFGHRREGLTCMGDASTDTGCHGNYNAGTGTINAHGSGNVGLLSNRMDLPVTDSAVNRDYYKLCFDCHDNYSTLLTLEELAGTAQGSNYTWAAGPYYIDFIKTGFSHYAMWPSASTFYKSNLHDFHFGSQIQWNYRGVETTSNRYGTCVSCHNVHGVSRNSRFLWDEWRYTIETITGVEWVSFDKNAGSGSKFDDNAYPEFCSGHCHTMFGSNSKYPRNRFNEAKSAASINSGTLGNGDTVIISFSDPTNAPATINTGNIDTILSLNNAHAWGTVLSAVWNSSDTLTITVSGDGSIAVDDIITFDESTITDLANTPIYGKITLLGI